MKKKNNTSNIYDKYITMENLYKMWDIIKSTCKNKKEVYKFSLNLNTNIYNIYVSLKNKTYVPDKYMTFMIFEPKPRLVMSQSIKDKIVNHFITNYYLIPYLESSLIDSNVATRKGKGSSYGNDLLQKYFNKLLINNRNCEIYCLKMDVSKYFYSINHDILMSMLGKRIKDNDVLNIIKLVISQTNNDYINKNISYYNNKYNTDIPYYINDTGLSIGAMVSQFLAIFFLNEIDHYIKEKLDCKYYIRYMDDLVILDVNKEKLKRIYNIISEKLNTLKLSVNKKSNIYSCSNGFSFLGYTYKTINNKLYVSCKKKTYNRVMKKLFYLQKHDRVKYRKSLGSYYGYLTNIDKINLKLNNRELFDLYRVKYNDYILIIKDKNRYYLFCNNALTIRILIGYKLSNKIFCMYNNMFDIILKKLSFYNIIVLNKLEILLEIQRSVT